MGFLEIVLLGLALSADTLAVSVSCALAHPKLGTASVMRIAIILALFQGLMPLVGWFCGTAIRPVVESISAWVAFALLLGVGGKMLIDSLRGAEQQTAIDLLRTRTLLVVALATSIDALSVGLGLALVSINILAVISVIGFATFAVAVVGLYFGNVLTRIKRLNTGVLAGIILIGMGCKILYEHLIT